MGPRPEQDQELMKWEEKPELTRSQRRALARAEKKKNRKKRK